MEVANNGAESGQTNETDVGSKLESLAKAQEGMIQILNSIVYNRIGEETSPNKETP